MEHATEERVGLNMTMTVQSDAARNLLCQYKDGLEIPSELLRAFSAGGTVGLCLLPKGLVHDFEYERGNLWLRPAKTPRTDGRSQYLVLWTNTKGEANIELTAKVEAFIAHYNAHVAVFAPIQWASVPTDNPDSQPANRYFIIDFR